MSTDAIVFTYRGDDHFYGVPRRSLTQADFDALTVAQQRDVLASTSYVERKEPPAAPKADTKKEA